MKLLKILSIIVIFIVSFSVYQLNKSETINITTTSNPPNADDYKTRQDDKDSIVESNKALVTDFRKIREEISQINSQQQQQFEKIKSLESKQENINTLTNNNLGNNMSGAELVALVKDTVNQNLPTTIGQNKQPTNYKIGRKNKGGDSPLVTVAEEYVWQSTLTKSSHGDVDVINHSKNNTAINSEDTFKNNIKADSNEADSNIPMYTIPSNTLLEGRLITALLGRIPVGGQVVDPYRFSIQVTNESFFANYHATNRFQGMMMSGTAQGDLLLSCVKATIDSVTFIFEDGTISDHKITDVAILTDEYGMPCIKGTLNTNAPTYLGASALFSGLDGAANAFARAEQTVSSDASGNSTSQVTGDAVRFAGLTALSNSVSDVQTWFDQRAESSFDVIFVPSGEKIQLLTQSKIEIDYQKQGRRLNYELSNLNTQEVNYELD